MSLNLYSVTCLTSVFLSEFGGFDAAAERCIVNITSMLGIRPMKSVGYYCVGKASREMYFRVLAAENPDLNVFSYCPGKRKPRDFEPEEAVGKIIVLSPLPVRK